MQGAAGLGDELGLIFPNCQKNMCSKDILEREREKDGQIPPLLASGAEDGDKHKNTVFCCATTCCAAQSMLLCTTFNVFLPCMNL